MDQSNPIIKKTLTKQSYFFTHDVDTANFNVYVDSRTEICKLRVSFSLNDLSRANNVPGFLIWSDLTSDYIGSCGTDAFIDVAGNEIVNDKELKPSDGIEIYYQTPKRLQSGFRFKLFNINGSLLDTTALLSVPAFNILFEYFTIESI